MPEARNSKDRLSLLLGQWFGTGLSPQAPGTVGSIGALPLFWLLRGVPEVAYWAAALGISALGVVVSERCSVLLGEKDPSSVVIDEVAGVIIALGFVRTSPLWVLGFAWVLFRVFDITKPWLIDKAQYLPPAGLGIMADDILAGIVAGAIALGGYQTALAFG